MSLSNFSCSPASIILARKCGICPHLVVDTSITPGSTTAPMRCSKADRADVLELRINGKRGDQVRPPCGTFVPIGRAGLLVG
jgi:hypothetical protein